MVPFPFVDDLTAAAAALRSTRDWPACDAARSSIAGLLDKVLDELDAMPRYVRGTLVSVDFEGGEEGEMILHVKTPASGFVWGDVEWRMVPFSEPRDT